MPEPVSEPRVVVLEPPAFRAPWEAPPQGPLVAPGRYSAELKVVSASGVRSLGAAQSCEVKPVPNLPPVTDQAAGSAFQGKTADIEIHHKSLPSLRERLNKLLSKHSGQPVDKIDRDTDRDNFLTAEEAVAYGLVDEVLHKRVQGA